MQSVIPAMVSTMPANVSGIMDRNQGALSPAMSVGAGAGLGEGPLLTRPWEMALGKI